jgi:RNA polymerase sigma factor (sigma-70 family)
LEFEELQEQLSELVATLPEKCQLVFKLSRDAGYTHKEIASELGISEKTVEAHLGKALKVLRNGLNYLLVL